MCGSRASSCNSNQLLQSCHWYSYTTMSELFDTLLRPMGVKVDNACDVVWGFVRHSSIYKQHNNLMAPYRWEVLNGPLCDPPSAAALSRNIKEQYLINLSVVVWSEWHSGTPIELRCVVLRSHVLLYATTTCECSPGQFAIKRSVLAFKVISLCGCHGEVTLFCEISFFCWSLTSVSTHDYKDDV